jgi:Predicted methyltransferase
VHIVQTFGEESALLWRSAVVLAQQWPLLLSSDGRSDGSALLADGQRVLELGAGLGLNAICLAARGASVVATEIEPALTALRESLARNRTCWEAGGGAISAVELRWGEPVQLSQRFDCVVCADVIYSRPLRPLLLQTLRRHVTEGTNLVLAFEVRGDEHEFVAEAARTLGMRARRLYGPVDDIEIHVLDGRSACGADLEIESFKKY